MSFNKELKKDLEETAAGALDIESTALTAEELKSRTELAKFCCNVLTELDKQEKEFQAKEEMRNIEIEKLELEKKKTGWLSTAKEVGKGLIIALIPLLVSAKIRKDEHERSYQHAEKVGSGAFTQGIERDYGKPTRLRD